MTAIWLRKLHDQVYLHVACAQIIFAEQVYRYTYFFKITIIIFTCGPRTTYCTDHQPNFLITHISDLRPSDETEQFQYIIDL